MDKRGKNLSRIDFISENVKSYLPEILFLMDFSDMFMAVAMSLIFRLCLAISALSDGNNIYTPFQNYPFS